MKRSKLKEEYLERIEQVLKARQPSKIDLMEKLSSFCASDDDINELREIVGDEFSEKGLQLNDEPNLYGLELEEINGWLFRLRDDS